MMPNSSNPTNVCFSRTGPRLSEKTSPILKKQDTRRSIIGNYRLTLTLTSYRELLGNNQCPKKLPSHHTHLIPS